MGRKERRRQKRAAKKFNSRKTVQASNKVLIFLAIITVVLVIATFYVRYSVSY
ncbi:MAG: hypothetical protein GX801_04520 [Fibrobacter sp.]|nr:hypothetical protein [Fibrobacter sp.]